MKLTRTELNQILARNKQLSLDETPPRSGLPGPLTQSQSGQALDTLLSGAPQGCQRVKVCFTGFRVRPCDFDNFTGGCKALLDCLRYAGLIPGDDPSRIELTVAQVKVAHRSLQRTEITITDA